MSKTSAAESGEPEELGRTPFWSSIMEADLVAMAEALKKGVSPKEMARRGGGALIIALDGGADTTPLVLALLKAGANPNPADNDEQPLPALVRAALLGRVDCIEPILAAGAELNGEDMHGLTACMRAAAYGQTEALRMLLAAGADIKAGHDRHSIMDLAAKSGSYECIDLLAAAGADVDKPQGEPFNQHRGTPLQAAAQRGHGNACAALLSHGANPNPKNPATSPLLAAALSGSHDCMQIILSHGGKIKKSEAIHLTLAGGIGYDEEAAECLGWLAGRLQAKTDAAAIARASAKPKPTAAPRREPRI